MGSSRQGVHHALGNPSLTRILNDGTREDSWRTRLPLSDEDSQSSGDHWKYHFVNVYFHKGQTVQVETNCPRFKTREGLSVQIPASRWKRAFAPTKETRNTNHLFINRDPSGIPATKHFLQKDDCTSRGIAWTSGFWANMSPEFDPNSPLETLIVHKAQHSLIAEPDTYIRFVFTSRDLPLNR